jgi:hypothetical protein
VREQLEHDRLIRHLAAKFKRKFEVAANVGDEQLASIKVGSNTFFPDLVLTADKKVAGVIEVETGESVNYLEAMAQWVHFGKARAPFSLYVPVTAYEGARRLCDAYKATVSEIWTYRGAMDGFDLIRMFHDARSSTPRSHAPKAAKPASSSAPAKARAKARAAKPAPKQAVKPAKKAARRPARAARPATAATRKAAARPAKPAKAGSRKK